MAMKMDAPPMMRKDGGKIAKVEKELRHHEKMKDSMHGGKAHMKKGGMAKCATGGLEGSKYKTGGLELSNYKTGGIEGSQYKKGGAMKRYAAGGHVEMKSMSHCGHSPMKKGGVC
jgi:hypothetical protein